jgi:hypothetical protein
MLSVIRPDFEVVKEERILQYGIKLRFLSHPLFANPERRSLLNYVRSSLFNDRVSSVIFARTGSIISIRG